MRKAIEVRKLDGIEDVITHPKFEEVKTSFLITCRYTVEGIDTTTYDNAETNAQSMQTEIVRLIKTLYWPINGTGIYSRVSRDWTNEDIVTETTHVLLRTLLVTLYYIRSDKTTVFQGYGGVLVFDNTNSQGDNKPGSNYTYTEAYDVQVEEGFHNIRENIVQNSDGKGVPVNFRGSFFGYFQCMMKLKKADIGSQTNQLNTIYKQLTTGEIANIVFLYGSPDTETVPVTLTETVTFKPTMFRRMYDLEDLVICTLRGELVLPSSLAYA